MELGMQKANELGMDIFEYFLGDYDHVIDQIKKNLSNLDVCENDRYRYELHFRYRFTFGTHGSQIPTACDSAPGACTSPTQI